MKKNINKDSVLYNYLYNYILKDPMYSCTQNNQKIAHNISITQRDIVPTLRDLDAKGMVNYVLYNHNQRIVTLPYTVAKLDKLHQQLDPSFHYDPKDYIRIANILMHQNDVDMDVKVKPSKPINKKIRPYIQNVFNTAETIYKRKIFSAVNMHVNINDVSVQLTREIDLENTPGVEMHVSCSHDSAGMDGPHYFALVQFVVAGRTRRELDKNLSDKLNQIFPTR